MNPEFQQRLDIVIAAAGLSGDYEISYKSAFGAVAGYADGRIFITCGKFGLALKLPEATCQKLFDSGDGQPLKYFEKGHTKQNYAVLAEPVLDDKRRLGKLVNESAAFVQDRG